MNDPILYAKSNPFQSRDADSVLKSYKGHLAHDSDTDNVLDIGCGSGNVTRNILAPYCGRYRNIVGVDISQEMIDYARQQGNPEDMFYEVLDIAGDVKHFRNAWGGFSKVFSFYCLHWVKDLPKAVGNIKKLMSIGGECLLVFVAQCPVFDMYERLAEKSKWEGYMEDVDNFVPVTHHHPQPAFLFCQIMEETGLQVVKCEVVEKDFTFSSPDMLRDCMCAVNPFIERIEKEDKSEFVMDCLRTLAALKIAGNKTNDNDNGNKTNLNQNENKGHRFTYKLLIAQARKR